MSDLCFMDTETLGLDPQAPIWEFAAIRVRTGFPVETREFTIEHEPGDWVESLPAQFRADYATRYSRVHAFTEDRAVEEIHFITNGATIVGCNPGFDTERVAGLLRHNGIEPAWHYHPLDIASLAQGWLAGRGLLPAGPWKSDQLSTLLGIEPALYSRHTAMGDARWCRAQWDRMMTAGPLPAAEQLEPWHGKAVVSQ